MEEDIGAIVALLQACTKRRDLLKGSRIHAYIISVGSLERNPYVGSTLVSMYAKCGSLSKAQEVCDRLPVRDVVLWNALIGGYAQHGHSEQALCCFARMQLEGLFPDAATFACILKACGSAGAAHVGQEMHVKIVREGLLERDVVVGTALVDMYIKCGLLARANEVFDKLPARDVVSWNAIISGYVLYGHCEQAMNCLDHLRSEGLTPNKVTFLCLLKACRTINAAERGQLIHAEIAREGLLEKDIAVGNALVDMYAKSGLLAEAHSVFCKLPVRDLISWTALIAGYTQHGSGEEALNCFDQMGREGHFADGVTFVFILKACGSIGATYKGQEVHADIVREGLLERDKFVGTALIDMYAKCGLLRKAEEVFGNLPCRGLVSWNVLIAGYALHGKAENVFYCFQKMMIECLKPDLSTFTSVLNACCHAGLLDKGQFFFDTMSTEYGMFPSMEHHTCMVDLFGRAGRLDKAVTVIKEMPFSADLSVWHTVLNACRKWGNSKLGRVAFEHAMHLDGKSAAAYICMSNVFSDVCWQKA